MQATIRTILAEVGRLEVPADTLDDHADLDEAGLSSHATVHVMLAIEHAFDNEIPDRMLTRRLFRSIQPLADAIVSLCRMGETVRGRLLGLRHV
ncbi:acyl carrier protein [Cupriavidus gilardii]|uniref:acyl carrier protein n=1 Tax=Cupriavidus gilardii TaxID=82541 RepID=UPI001ABE02C5|nr:acyl carrier protein [Cupriavidus gilardii]MBO4123758.1 acyl carrier protein [Cupriavidus gilardii]